MTTKNRTKWTALVCLAGLLTLSSCSKEASSTAQGVDFAQSRGEVGFSLGATIGIDFGDMEARAISLSLGKNSKDQLVPTRKAFKDGEKVPVHTAIRNAAGTAYGAKTIEWTYNAKDKQLRLMQTDAGNDITVTGNYTEGDVWFVAGVIGGDLLSSGDKVSFAAERVLRDIQVAEGQDITGLVVPYAFPWTVMVAETHKAKEGNSNLHKYHYSGTVKPSGLLSSAATFKPQGFVITANLGNKTVADLKMEGFSIQTNAFSDNGVFDFTSTEAVSNGSAVVFKPEYEDCPIEYSFAEELVLTKQVPEARTYYLWAYPTEAGKTGKETYTKVAMYGERQDGVKDYSHTYLVDHISQTSKSYKSAKVYNLPVNATKHVRLPIEYVANYDLAGGVDNGITYRGVTAQVGSTTAIDLNTPSYSRGPLRLANRLADGGLRPNGSYPGGAYNHYYVADQLNQHDIFNASGLKIRDMQLIDEDGKTIPFSSKYRMPDHDDLWGVFPRFGGSAALDPNYNTVINWNGNNSSIVGKTINEEIKIGEGMSSDMALMQYYSAEWNAPRRTATEAVVTAIRLQKHTGPCTASTLSTLFYGEPKHIYSPALNNRLRSAYRYKLYRAPSAGSEALLIEVVHLGEKSTVTAAEVDQDAWWVARRNAGEVLSRTMYLSQWSTVLPYQPTQQVIGQQSNPASSDAYYNAYWVTYWGRNLFGSSDANAQGTRVRAQYAGPNANVLQGSNVSSRQWLLSVRPFYNNSYMK